MCCVFSSEQLHIVDWGLVCNINIKRNYTQSLEFSTNLTDTTSVDANINCRLAWLGLGSREFYWRCNIKYTALIWESHTTVSCLLSASSQIDRVSESCWDYKQPPASSSAGPNYRTYRQTDRPDQIQTRPGQSVYSYSTAHDSVIFNIMRWRGFSSCCFLLNADLHINISNEIIMTWAAKVSLETEPVPPSLL